MALGSFLALLLIPALIFLFQVLTIEQSFTVRMFSIPVAIFGGVALVSVISSRQVRRTLRGAMGERSDPLKLANGVVVTPQAQELEMMLLMRYRRLDPAHAEQHKRTQEYARKHKVLAAYLGLKTVEEIRSKSEKALAELPQSVMAGLEQAAAQYERCVRLSQTVPEAAEAVQSVADESMVAVLHGAHRIAKAPESLGEVEPRVWASADTLRELADNIEALTSQGSFTPTAGIHDLLDEFRHKLAAPWPQ